MKDRNQFAGSYLELFTSSMFFFIALVFLLTWLAFYSPYLALVSLLSSFVVDIACDLHGVSHSCFYVRTLVVTSGRVFGLT